MSNEAQNLKNQILANLATFAIENGVNVETAEGRNEVRQMAVTILVKEFGCDIEKAFNLIWGENAYETMKGQVYDALKKVA